MNFTDIQKIVPGTIIRYDSYRRSWSPGMCVGVFQAPRPGYFTDSRGYGRKKVNGATVVTINRNQSGAKWELGGTSVIEARLIHSVLEKPGFGVGPEVYCNDLEAWHKAELKARQDEQKAEVKAREAEAQARVDLLIDYGLLVSYTGYEDGVSSSPELDDDPHDWTAQIDQRGRVILRNVEVLTNLIDLAQ